VWLATLALAACEKETSPPPEETPDPLVLLAKKRLLPVDTEDLETIREIGGVEPADIGDGFAVALLQRQVWDEEYVQTDGVDGSDFVTRVRALQADADSYGSLRYVLALDLLKRDGSDVYCPGGALEARFCKLTKQRFTDKANEMVYNATQALGPELFVVGRGVNRLATPDPEAYAAFVEWWVGPVLAAGVRGEKATTSIDWEVFRADVAARAEADELTEAEAAEAVWADQLAAFVEHWDVVALDSRPSAADPSDLPDDYYALLADLIPENKPVVFTSLSWPTPSENDWSEAVTFLQRFRWLVAGLNVRYVAWERLVDASEDRCKVLTRIGVPVEMCTSGLIKAVGAPKQALWDEYLDESAPPPPAQ